MNSKALKKKMIVPDLGRCLSSNKSWSQLPLPPPMEDPWPHNIPMEVMFTAFSNVYPKFSASQANDPLLCMTRKSVLPLCLF